MGSIWQLSAGGESLLTGKNYLSDQVMLLFTERDRLMDKERYKRLLQVWDAGRETAEAASRRLYVFRTSVRTMRARLDLQGFALADVRHSAVQYLQAEREDEERYLPDELRDIEAQYATPSDVLDGALKWRPKSQDSPPRLQDAPEEYFLSQVWDDLCEAFDDPRFSLSLALASHRGDERVLLDLTELLLGGWLEPDELPHLTAQRRLANEISASGPVIVVTEGSTDARLLSHALRLAEPELATSFSFLDLEGASNPGGADKLVSVVRGMAAASVMNRVIAVLDNDAAGRDAQRILLQGRLPPHMTVTRLPDVTYGRRYPSDGPDGRRLSVVNGRATAIEMMFGLDVLKCANGGELPPVRWSSYVLGVRDYQGAIAAKAQVQEHLFKSLGTCERLDTLDRELAAGCRRLARMLVTGAAKATPTMASQYSSLLAHRVREGADPTTAP